MFVIKRIVYFFLRKSKNMFAWKKMYNIFMNNDISNSKKYFYTLKSSIVTLNMNLLRYFVRKDNFKVLKYFYRILI